MPPLFLAKNGTSSPKEAAIYFCNWSAFPLMCAHIYPVITVEWSKTSMGLINHVWKGEMKKANQIKIDKLKIMNLAPMYI